MKEAEHNDPVSLYHEINRVRKSPQQAATEFLMNLPVKQWIASNLARASIEHPKEFLSDPR